MSSAKRALERYYEKLQLKLDREQRPKRANEKPELVVQQAVMKWLKQNEFSCHVVDSKAVFSRKAGRYIQSKTIAGYSDISGNTKCGLACFLEIKASGRRSTLRPGQRAFLMEKIQLGCFAVCVDSVECLEAIWIAWQHRRKMSPELAKNLLMRHLPKDSSGEVLSFDD